MALSYNGNTNRDSDIETLSAKISTAANKRKALCLDCGHTWEPRSSNTRKPSLCSKCKSRNCAWDDEIHTVKTAYSTAALMATVNGEPVTVEPIPKQTEEEPASSTIAAEIVRQLKEEVEQTKPKGYAITSMSGSKEPVILSDGEDESEPDNKLVKAVVNEVQAMIQDGDNTEPKKSIKIKNDVSVDTKEENDSKAVCEALRQILGDDVQVIDKPIKKLSEDREGETPYAVWQNEKGEIAYGVIVNPETFEEFETLLEEKETSEILTKTDENLERMNRGGLLDIETVLDESEETEDYEDEDTEANEGEPEKEKKGIPVVAVLILGGVTIATVLPVIMDVINEHKQKRKTEAKLTKNANTSNIPKFYQSMPSNLLKGF